MSRMSRMSQGFRARIKKKQQKTMSQVHVTHACHIWQFWTLSWATYVISSTRQPLLLENIFNSYSRLLWRPWGRVPVLPHLRQWWQRWIAQVGHHHHHHPHHHHRHHRHHHHHYHGHSHLLFLWRQSWPAHRHTTSSSFSECFNVVRMCDRKLGVYTYTMDPLCLSQC